MSSGEQLKIEGMSASLAAGTVGHHDHRQRVESVLDTLVASGREFSADQVRDVLPHDTRAWLDAHPNVLPAVFGAARARGVIRQIGWCTPARKSRHGNVNRVWVGARP